MFNTVEVIQYYGDTINTVVVVSTVGSVDYFAGIPSHLFGDTFNTVKDV